MLHKRTALIAAVAVLCGPVSLAAQTAAPPIVQEPQTIRLWTGTAPGALGNEDRDVPTITVYLPSNTTGPMTAVVVAPGGSYRALAMNHEGRGPANYLNALGVAAFVLKYRLGPRYHHPVQLGDAQRAIRTVRARAAEWHIAPDRIGIMGFSAGGHLASTAATHFDHGDANATDPIERAGSRPDFAILGYPVISMTEAWTHAGSRSNLLGDTPEPVVARSLSNETQVTAQTPPTFIFHTTVDATVPVENSIHYFLALRKASVPAEMHVFAEGRHGVGLALQDAALSAWPTLLANWLRARGLVGGR